MDFTWQEMTLGEYASFCESQGVKTTRADRAYWGRVRPFFYRPLLLCREYAAGSVGTPMAGRLGGYQHALPDVGHANSFLNVLMFENPQQYEPGSLSSKRRRELRIAEQEFVVRPIRNLNEFVSKAYSVYLDFYERTGYEYKSERQDPEVFSRWAGEIFQHPKALVLGSFRQGNLSGICISQLVAGVLLYSTVFSNTESLRHHVTGLLLHKVREAAAGTPGVRSILAGPYKYESAKGVDDFYLARGCKLVRKPALLKLSPLAGVILRHCLPAQYNLMLGRISG